MLAAAAVFLTLTAWLIASSESARRPSPGTRLGQFLATFITLLLVSWTVPWPLFVWQFLVPLKDPVRDSWVSNAAQGAASQIYSLIVSVLSVIGVYGVIGPLLTVASISRLKARWGQ